MRRFLDHNLGDFQASQTSHLLVMPFLFAKLRLQKPRLNIPNNPVLDSIQDEQRECEILLDNCRHKASNLHLLSGLGREMGRGQMIQCQGNQTDFQFQSKTGLVRFLEKRNLVHSICA